VIESTVEHKLGPMGEALNDFNTCSPLANEILTGKYRSQGVSESGRMSTAIPNPTTSIRIEVIHKL